MTSIALFLPGASYRFPKHCPLQERSWLCRARLVGNLCLDMFRNVQCLSGVPPTMV
jgi:hypothetical protein